MTENQKKPPPSPLQRGNVVTEKREKPLPIHILRSRGLPFEGECGDGKPVQNLSTTSRCEPGG